MTPIPPQQGAAAGRQRWGFVVLLVAVGIVNMFDRSTLAIANHNVSGELHLSSTQMGLLLSAFSLAYAFSQLPIGVALDRVGARIVLGAGLFVWSVAQLLCGFVGTLPQFLAARVALGVGEAPTFPAGAKMIADWFGPKERGGPTGIFLSAPTLGPMLAPPVLTVLMLRFGWRQMFMTMGVVGILLSVLWYWVVRDRDSAAVSADEVTPDGAISPAGVVMRKITLAEWGGLFVQRTTWGLVLGFVGVVYMVWLYLTWLPVYLEHERHLSLAQVGWVASIPYVFGTLGTLFCGYLADYLLRRGLSPINSRKWPICIGLIGGAAFTVPAAYTPGVGAAVAYLCGAMFFIYMASGGAWALINVSTPRHLMATVGGLQNFGGYFGGSFAPLITGWLVQRTHSFQSALLLSSVVAFLSAVIYLVLVTEPVREAGRL